MIVGIGLRRRLALRAERDLAHSSDERVQPVAERLEWLESSLDRGEPRSEEAVRLPVADIVWWKGLQPDYRAGAG